MHLLIKASLLGMVFSATFKPRACSYVQSNGDCQVCNLNLNYYNDGAGGCNSHFSTKCAFLDHNGSCLGCKESASPSGPFCLKSSAVANCQFYQPGVDGVCLYCQDKYYLSGNTCVAPTNAVDNCIYYTADKVCAQCKTGFIVKNSACVSAISNCLVQTGPRCTTCAPNTFLVPTTTISTVFDKSFWAYLYQVNTLGWSATQQSTSTYCAANTDCNCATAGSMDNCTACKENYYLASNGKCTPIPSSLQGTGCAVYNNTANTFACTACKSGFYMSNSVCVANPVVQKVARCTYYRAPGQCSRCEQTFYFNGINCVPAQTTIANCTVYGFDNVCRYCNLTANTYNLNGACVSLVDQNFTNCAAHNSQGCSACDPGYVLDANKNCVSVPNPPITNCGRYSSFATCSECPEGYFLSGTACYPVADANCYFFKSTGVCDYCKNGFYMNQTTNTCVAGTSIPRCLVIYANGLCGYCANGFYLNDAKTGCIGAPTANCKSYANSTTCSVCTPPKFYDPSTNTCKTSTQTSTITNCYRFATDSTCLQCTYPYYLTAAGTCGARASGAPIFTNCAAIGTDPTKCMLCDATYVLAVAGTCSAAAAVITNCDSFAINSANAEICAECAADYYLTADGTSCTAILSGLPLANCGSYNATLTLNVITSLACARCTGDFYLSSGACSAAAPAVTGCEHYNSEGKCRYCADQKRLIPPVTSPSVVAASCVAYALILNCKIYSAFNVCTQCQPGFTPSLDGSSCGVSAGTATAQCARYSTTTGSLTVCTECQDGYYLQNSLCVPFGTGLLNCKYQKAPYGCEVCLDNFYLDNIGACQSVPLNTVNNCAEYSSVTTCSTCKPGFVLNVTQCQALTGVSSCLKYSDASNCLVCEKGYYLSSGMCAPATNIIANCTVYANATTCSNCAYGTAMITNGTACVNNCETADANGCTKCGPLSFLAAGACTLVTNFVDSCMYYSANGMCARCIQDFLLLNNACTRLNESVSCSQLDDAIPSCSLCAPGFRVSGGLCVANPASTTANCLFSDTTGACVMCADKYYHDRSSNTCISIYATK